MTQSATQLRSKLQIRVPNYPMEKLTFTQNKEKAVKYLNRSHRQNITKLHRFHAARLSYYFAKKAEEQLSDMYKASGYDKNVLSIFPIQFVRNAADFQQVKLAPVQVHLGWFGSRSIHAAKHGWILPRRKRLKK